MYKKYFVFYIVLNTSFDIYLNYYKNKKIFKIRLHIYCNQDIFQNSWIFKKQKKKRTNYFYIIKNWESWFYRKLIIFYWVCWKRFKNFILYLVLRTIYNQKFLLIKNNKSLQTIKENLKIKYNTFFDDF